MRDPSTYIGACWKCLRHKLLAPAVPVSVITLLSLLAFAATGPVTGGAVIYSDSMDGKAVAMKGEHYDKSGMTAATHSNFPMGSSVKVTNLENNKSVVVKINDRVNPKSRSVVDLSRKAAEGLDMMNAGHVRVRVELAGK